MLKILILVSSLALLTACGNANEAAGPASGADGQAAAGMGMGPPPGEGMGDGGGFPDFSEAAAQLGVTTEQLQAAVEKTGAPPPDFAAIAKELDLDAAAVEAAMPKPPE